MGDRDTREDAIRLAIELNEMLWNRSRPILKASHRRTACVTKYGLRTYTAGKCSFVDPGRARSLLCKCGFHLS